MGKQVSKAARDMASRRQKPGLVQRGLARRRYGLVGPLVKARPVNKKGAKRVTVDEAINRVAAEATVVAGHAEVITKLRQKNRRLVTVKAQVKARKKIVREAVAERKRIIQRASRVARKDPNRGTVQELRQLNQRLQQLTQTVVSANTSLRLLKPEEERLVGELRKLSKQNHQLREQTGI